MIINSNIKNPNRKAIIRILKRFRFVRIDLKNKNQTSYSYKYFQYHHVETLNPLIVKFKLTSKIKDMYVNRSKMI